MNVHRSLRLTLGCFVTVLAGCSSNKQVSPLRAASNVPATAPAVSVATPTTSPATLKEADELRETLTYIASDDLEGRGLMTAGLDKAADYIAKHFADAGLKPLPGLDGYFQPFSTVVDTHIDDDTKLSLAGKPLELHKDFTLLGMQRAQHVRRPAGVCRLWDRQRPIQVRRLRRHRREGEGRAGDALRAARRPGQQPLRKTRLVGSGRPHRQSQSRRRSRGSGAAAGHTGQFSRRRSTDAVLQPKRRRARLFPSCRFPARPPTIFLGRPEKQI